MDKIEYEYYKHEYDEGISKSDIFLKDHYEELFYMTPKELAGAINAMNEDELIRFNKTIHKGHGMNVDLINDKLDELCKYQNLNYSIFMNALCRISFIDGLCSLPDYSDKPYKETFHKLFTTFKYFFEDEGKEGEGKHPNTDAKSYDILFLIYPAFHKHFSKLKAAGIIEKTENGLKWNRKDIAVAEYFDYIECKDRRQRWVVVEKVFNNSCYAKARV